MESRGPVGLRDSDHKITNSSRLTVTHGRILGILSGLTHSRDVLFEWNMKQRVPHSVNHHSDASCVSRPKVARTSIHTGAAHSSASDPGEQPVTRPPLCTAALSLRREPAWSHGNTWYVSCSLIDSFVIWDTKLPLFLCRQARFSNSCI